MFHQLMYDGVVAGRMLQRTYDVEVPTPIFQLKLRRTALIKDTFRQLDNADHDNLKKTLVVRRKRVFAVARRKMTNAQYIVCIYHPVPYTTSLRSTTPRTAVAL